MPDRTSAPTPPLRLRAQIAVMRQITRLLRRLGLREEVMRRRQALAWRRRRAAGPDDPLSHPALHGMDHKLDALLDKDGGFFVEAGANDGYTQSNTYWLERFRGWRGILVEPMGAYADMCRRGRPGAAVVQAALVPSDHAGDTVRMHFGDLMSTVQGAHGDEQAGREWVEPGLVLGWYDAYDEDVPARTLSSVLEEHGAPEVDLLSLDVEGFEPAVLRGLDLDRHAPRWVLVEMHDLEAGRREIGTILGDRYVEHGPLSPLDVLYRRADVPAPSAS
jgi:FkbM family methyltransferase